MKRINYQSGIEVKVGDKITYYGGLGTIEFLVTESVGNPSLDWYLEQFGECGFMIDAAGFGRVFISESDIDEDLQFVSRK
ncbi:MAG TPA: hypothetical protein VM056_01115 [Terriglobales bacterium]|nr:hypothetical protein [Terriglobales bacterium]